jgi:two-component system, OmpR family, response regulator
MMVACVAIQRIDAPAPIQDRDPLACRRTMKVAVTTRNELLATIRRNSLMPRNTLEKILYVEDDLDIQVVGSMALEQVGGFSVTMVSTGTEALATVTDYQPDVILLDVMMPDMDGLATLARLRADSETKGIPVIFMTAKVQNREIDQYLASGAIGVIPKPFDPMALAGQVREIWHRYCETGTGDGRDV